MATGACVQTISGGRKGIEIRSVHRDAGGERASLEIILWLLTKKQPRGIIIHTMGGDSIGIISRRTYKSMEGSAGAFPVCGGKQDPPVSGLLA